MNINNQFNNFNQMNNYINYPNNNMAMNMNFNNNQNNFLNNDNMNQNFNNFFLNQFDNMNLNGNYFQQILNNIKNEDDEEEKNIEYRIYPLYNNEKELIYHADNIKTTMNEIRIIYHQMKNCLCYINNSYNGFLCYIPYEGKKIPALITNSSCIYLPENKGEINISMDNGNFKIKLKINKNDILYNNKKYDVIMIRISPNDKFNNNNFMELDDNLLTNNYQLIEVNKPLYTLYNNEKGISLVSYGSFNQKIGFNLIYSCKTRGGPILNLETNKVIGFKQEYDYRGTFLKYVLNDYLNKNNSQINITLEIDEIHVNNKVYFLDNTEYHKDKNEIYLKELNENNVKLLINGTEHKYKKYFIPKKSGKYLISLKFKDNIKDCSFMFYHCDNIVEIDLSTFRNENIENMESMFRGCSNLEYIDLYSINTKNVTNMANMFEGCSKLYIVDLTSFRTGKVTNMENMFYGCTNLMNLNLISFNTKNVTNMSGMFIDCIHLNNLNLSYFNTENVTNMGRMFHNCGVKYFDLLSFSTKNVINMSDMFSHCNNCRNINFPSFNTEKVTNMSGMFRDSSFITIDLSSFNTKNVINMAEMFMNCHKLRFVNLSSFCSDKLENMDFMFYWCNNLLKVDISSFDINKVKSRNHIFGLSSFDVSNDIAYEGPKDSRSIKVNKNSIEEIKKEIYSNLVKIIEV